MRGVSKLITLANVRSVFNFLPKTAIPNLDCEEKKMSTITETGKASGAIKDISIRKNEFLVSLRFAQIGIRCYDFV